MGNQASEMNASADGEVIVPRNFKLLDEYDAATGKEGKNLILDPHNGYISYGAVDSESETPDINLHDWEGIIIGPQGSHIGELMFSVRIKCSDDYPMVPPEVSFQGQQIRMACVGPDGKVDVHRIEVRGSGTFQWNPHKNIADVLMALRAEMHSPQVAQATHAIQGQFYN